MRFTRVAEKSTENMKRHERSPFLQFTLGQRVIIYRHVFYDFEQTKRSKRRPKRVFHTNCYLRSNEKTALCPNVQTKRTR